MNRRLHRTALALAAAATLTLAGCAAEDTPPAGDGAETAGEMTDDSMADQDMTDDMTDEPADEDMADEMVPAVYEFSATTLDGGTFEGATLAGSPAVLWFWAPWCPTCIMQIPTVTGLAETYGGDVAVVGVGGLDDAEAISDMAEKNIPHVTHLVDDAGEVWQHFGMTQQSTFVVLDADGEIVAEGTVPETELESLVADLAS
ncbi:TlpA family protein disulfide reductase [Isoptericola croceus]|uniref:TlpA family protein disulfide reductase n=1 Tax=Isoptericola croceus TaxID=3031406 RepID=UPI0023F8B6A4|nr:redoxin family protein [Isoptericola croceus]